MKHKLMALVFLMTVGCAGGNHVADLQRQIQQSTAHIDKAIDLNEKENVELNYAKGNNGSADKLTDTVNSDLIACHSARDAAITSLKTEQDHWIGAKTRNAAKKILIGLAIYGALVGGAWLIGSFASGGVATFGMMAFHLLTAGVIALAGWINNKVHQQTTTKNVSG